MPQVSKESAGQVVVAYLKKQKKTDQIDVAMVEENNGGYIVRGITPINLEGHNWAERFTVKVDNKGKVQYADYALL
ncbi:MAG: hypothetical protein ACQCN3_15340 [Candidatus Bathyarchaeia archaeon]